MDRRLAVKQDLPRRVVGDNCCLVPDLMRVDERGWVYVAEESGYLAGYAPKPMLTLVKGGEANQTGCS